MTKAESQANLAYPEDIIDASPLSAYPNWIDRNLPFREGFVNGYEQAEKDLALTWEDIQTIDNIVVDMAHNTDWPLRGQEVFYTEVLNRFNKSKEKK